MNGFRKKMKDNSGFTLVEIAIVMVIIGLLIGGVLKGQEMIKNAKIKRVVKTSDEIRAAVFTYQDRFGYYPGDDPLATTHTGDAGVTNGGGNGQIAGAEDEHVFEHLATVGLITGSAASYAGGDFPTHPFGGTYYVLWQNRNGKTSNWITYTLVPVDAAIAMDSSLDDGVYTTGSIRASGPYTGTAALTVYVDL
jgi:prepilin-type N-terminal cleavage/methylation domain-containing protein